MSIVNADSACDTSVPLPRVVVLATGSTIAGRAGSGAQLTGYTAGVIGAADELTASVPELRACARVEAEQIAAIDSSQMTVAVWLKLAKRINELLAGDVDGVVVTHTTLWRRLLTFST